MTEGIIAFSLLLNLYTSHTADSLILYISQCLSLALTLHKEKKRYSLHRWQNITEPVLQILTILLKYTKSRQYWWDFSTIYIQYTELKNNYYKKKKKRTNCCSATFNHLKTTSDVWRLKGRNTQNWSNRVETKTSGITCSAEHEPLVKKKKKKR